MAAAAAPAITKQLEELTFAVVSDSAPAELQKRSKALFSALDSEALLAAFKVLPRSLTYPSIDTFLSAEQKLSTNTVSNILVGSDFAGCEPAGDAKFVATVATALERTQADASLAAAIYKWRIVVCAHRPAVSNVERHAIAAMVYALSTPQCVNVEPLADAVKDVAFATTDGKVLSALLAATLDGKGVAELTKAAPTLASLEIADAVTRKVRVLDVSAYCASKREVTYAELQTRLGVKSDDEVENLVLDAASVGVVDAKVNKADKKVSVVAAVPLRFDKQAWETLKVQADAFGSVVASLLAEFERGRPAAA